LAIITTGIILGLYVAAFEFMYLQRGPAANMFYFVYSENETVDNLSYRFFYPAYWIQQHVFNGQKHNDDREPVNPLAD
jgi:hypothetical protein